MAATNFAALHPEQKLVWARKTWAAARERMFLKKLMGTSSNSPVHVVKELTKTEKGDRCIYHLVADLVEDGVVGDSPREGYEEAMQSYSQIITIDLLAHQVRNTGKMADQRTTIDARAIVVRRAAHADLLKGRETAVDGIAGCNGHSGIHAGRQQQGHCDHRARAHADGRQAFVQGPDVHQRVHMFSQLVWVGT